MCTKSSDEIRKAVQSALEGGPDPLSTAALVARLESQGLCRFHIRHELHQGLREGRLIAHGAPTDQSPINFPDARWTVPPSSPPPPATPEGEYEVIEPNRAEIKRDGILGRGGMGVVYVGRQPTLGRPCAIKILAPDVMRDAKGKPIEAKRLAREIRILARLSHPSIITVYDGGTVPSTGSPYLVMELMEWPTLYRLVKERGPLPPLQVAKFLRSAAAGLKYAYDRGPIYHRDLKPANLFVDLETGQTKVADFGLGCFDEGFVDVPAGESSVSREIPGTILGTPSFQAPERYTLAKGDHRSDNYSLGITGYWAMAGAHPFPGLIEGQSTYPDWVNAHLNVDTMALPLRHPSRRPDCPERLAEIIHRMIRRDPAARYQSYAELIQDLDRLIRELEPRTTRIQRAVPAPPAAADCPSVLAKVLDRFPAPTPRSESTASGLPTYFVPEELGALNQRITAVEARYEKLYGPEALYFPGQPVLGALAALAREKGVLPVLRAIYELDTDQEAPDFESLYVRLVADEDLPTGKRDIPLSPPRYCYDAHGLALRTPDPEVAERAKALAEKVLVFLEESLEAPEIVALRTGNSKEAPPPAAAPTETSPPAPVEGPGPSQTVTKALRIAGRLKPLERLKEDFHKAQVAWQGTFPHPSFPLGPTEVIAFLWQRAKSGALLPLLQKVAERHAERAIPDFAGTYESLLLAFTSGTSAPDVRTSGVDLNFLRHAWDDMEFALAEAKADRDYDPLLTRRTLELLCQSINHPSLDPFRKSPRVAPTAPPATHVLSVPPDDALPPGTQVGQFRIIRKLGTGGMGTVYLAHDAKLDREVALKILKRSLAEDQENLRRFQTEIKIAARFDHPNIAHVYETTQFEGLPVLVMAFIEGTSLAAYLRQKNRLSPEEALPLIRQAALGLAHAHKADLIHRDIKPDNLMFDLSGRVVVMDFGLMKSVRVKTRPPTGETAKTSEGVFVGTPEYAAPEQANAGSVDRRTDIYALGATLYELLSGARPFTAPSQISLLHKIADEATLPRPLTQLVPGIDPSIEVLVDRMMAKRPEDRYQACEDVIQAIDRILADRAALALRSGRGGRRLLLGGAAALLLAGLLAWLFWPRSNEKETGKPVAFEIDRREPPAPEVKPEPRDVKPKVTEEVPPSPPPRPPEEPKPQPPKPKETEPKPPEVPKPPPPLPAKIPDVKLPGPDGPIPLSPPKEATASHILANHKPSKAELDLLEEFLRTSASTLARREAYDLEIGVAKALAFRTTKGKEITPWLSIFVESEIERLRAGEKAFRARPLLPAGPERELVLRDGRTLRAKILDGASDPLAIELPSGFREDLALTLVAPATFRGAAEKTLEALLPRSAAADAAGTLTSLELLEETDRRRFGPLLFAQAMDELLYGARTRRAVKALADFRIPDPVRGLGEPLFPARLKLFAGEQEAARLYLRRNEDREAFRKLFLEHPSTVSGRLAAREDLAAFQKAIDALRQPPGSPDPDHFEIGDSANWGHWLKDLVDAPGGSIVPDHQKDTYTLTALAHAHRVRLRRQLKGAQKGYQVRWVYAGTSGDSTLLSVAINFTRWLEVTPQAVSLFKKSDEKPIDLARKIDLQAPIKGGLLSIVPQDDKDLVLVYLGDELLFALSRSEYALADGLQIAAGGGSLTITSIRVLDRTRE